MPQTQPDNPLMPMSLGQVSVFRGHSVYSIGNALNNGFDIASVDAEGNSCLHLVCMPHQLQEHAADAIQLVTSTSVNFNLRNIHGWTPLMLASLLLPVNLVQIVLKGCENPESLDDSLHESLLLAAAYSKPDVVSALIRAGAKIIESPSHEFKSLRVEKFKKHRKLLGQIDTLLGLYPEFDREVAQFKDLEATDLVRLASSEDGPTKQFVALNPNTPSNILLKLAPEFPRAFYKNPAFDWLLLENPDLLFEMKQGVLKHILSLRDCPESMLLWACRNGSDSEKLAVVRRLDVAVELLQIIASGKPCKAASIAIASNSESTLSQLKSICGKDDSADRLLALHPNANASLLANLSESSDDIVRKNVFANKKTTADIMKKMSDGHIRVHRLQ